MAGNGTMSPYRDRPPRQPPEFVAVVLHLHHCALYHLHLHVRVNGEDYRLAWGDGGWPVEYTEEAVDRDPQFPRQLLETVISPWPVGVRQLVSDWLDGLPGGRVQS